eukprot:PhF_6_TR1044/c0_g1_i2/m.2147
MDWTKDTCTRVFNPTPMLQLGYRHEPSGLTVCAYCVENCFPTSLPRDLHTTSFLCQCPRASAAGCLFAGRRNEALKGTTLTEYCQEHTRRFETVAWPSVKDWALNSADDLSTVMVVIPNEKRVAMETLALSTFNPETFSVSLLVEFLAWFRSQCFSFEVDEHGKPKQLHCSFCTAAMRLKRTDAPNTLEILAMATKTPVYECPACLRTQRAPRYRHPAKLTELRRGGIFEATVVLVTLLHHLGCEARAVVGGVDTYWVEVWDDKALRWLSVCPSRGPLHPHLLSADCDPQKRGIYACDVRGMVVDAVPRYVEFTPGMEHYVNERVRNKLLKDNTAIFLKLSKEEQTKFLTYVKSEHVETGGKSSWTSLWIVHNPDIVFSPSFCTPPETGFNVIDEIQGHIERICLLVESTTDDNDDAAVLRKCYGEVQAWQHIAVEAHANRFTQFKDCEIDLFRRAFLWPIYYWHPIWSTLSLCLSSAPAIASSTGSAQIGISQQLDLFPQSIRSFQSNPIGRNVNPEEVCRSQICAVHFMTKLCTMEDAVKDAGAQASFPRFVTILTSVLERRAADQRAIGHLMYCICNFLVAVANLIFCDSLLPSLTATRDFVNDVSTLVLGSANAMGRCTDLEEGVVIAFGNGLSAAMVLPGFTQYTLGRIQAFVERGNANSDAVLCVIRRVLQEEG